jgi:nucleoside-triphosphatase
VSVTPARALLLTGLPGNGKTTVLRRVAERLAGRRLRGFLTDEVRVGRERTGFRIETLDGRTATLARVGLETRHRVGRYGVDVTALDHLVASSLAAEPDTIFLVDEVGTMECLSARFVAAMRALLDAGVPLVATVALRGGGFIAELKARPDVTLWTVTPENRDDLPERVATWVTNRREIPSNG